MKWGEQHHRAHHSTIGMKPGDFIFYGTTAMNIHHIGIVSKVYSNGHIDTIEGNSGNKVAHHVNFDPKARGIYGYVSVPE